MNKNNGKNVLLKKSKHFWIFWPTLLRLTLPTILSAPILSAPILSYLSANSAAYLSTPFSDYTHLQPYLKLYLSIFLLYPPISKLSAYNSYLSLLLCPSLPPSLPSYFSVLVILPKLQCPPLFSPYDNFKSRKNSAQKLNYSLKRWKSTPSLCQIWWLSYLKSKHQQT